MNPRDDLRRENRALRERLALLSQASLSINESLDFDTVLQGVLDSARSLGLPEMPASRASWFWEMPSRSSSSHTATGLSHTRGAEGPVVLLRVSLDAGAPGVN